MFQEEGEMMNGNIKRICPICGTEFDTSSDFLNRRKYCSEECARKGHIQTIYAKREAKKEELYECLEVDCMFFNNRFSNNCNALERVFISDCPFKKKKSNKAKKEK